MKAIEYIDRQTGTRQTETVMGDGFLRFAYETLLGRTIWPVIFGSGFCSRLLGAFYDSRLSRRAVANLAKLPGCHPDEAEKPVADYATFNAFFTRRLRPGQRPFGEGVTSPAEGRLRLWLDADLDVSLPIKGATRTLREVMQPKDVPVVPAGRYDIVVIRLAPVDYHRFHFPCDCKTAEPPRVVPGAYHSVNPVALLRRPDVYATNERQVLRCEAAFGPFWLVEVGAFGVGTIVQTFTGDRHAKGDEKGYFKFGGSTVIFVSPTGAVRFDDDLVRNSQEGVETFVRVGERMGTVPALDVT